MVPWDRDKLPTLHGTIPAKPGETLDASHIQTYWQQHLGARQRRRRRVLAGRGRLVRSVRAHQAPPALLPGQPLDHAERAAVEPAAQRLPGHRAVGRMGLVGRHRDVVEDARGADCRRHQLFAQHRAVLGLRHRRVLPEQRAHRRALRALVPVRGVLRIVPIARSHLVDALAMGLGSRRHGPARERQSQHAAAARRSPQHPAVRDEQPGDRAGRQEIRRAAVSADAIHLHAGLGGARRRPAADARDVAALSRTTRRRAASATQFLWGRDLLVAPVYTKGATSRDVYLPQGDWYDWWTSEKSTGGTTRQSHRRSRHDADLRARGRRSSRSIPSASTRRRPSPSRRR